MTFPLNTLDGLIANTVAADALRQALDTELFAHLDTPQSAESLAQLIGWHPAPTAHLLELLWSFDFLTRREARYQLAEEAAPYLSPQGERYIGDAWRYRLRAMRYFGQQWPEMLAQPLPQYSEQLPHDAAWAEAADVQIAQEQRALTADSAIDISRQVPHFNGPARMLDMGGGAGLVSVALGQRYPQLQGVLQDLPLTAAVAQRHFDESGLGERFKGVSALAPEDRFDIIWCSSFLHFVDSPAATLAGFYQRLRPGGILISAHAMIGDEPEQARKVLPFFLPLLMRGKHVLHQGEMAQLLTATGFSVIHNREYPFPLAPLQVHLALKGEQP